MGIYPCAVGFRVGECVGSIYMAGYRCGVEVAVALKLRVCVCVCLCLCSCAVSIIAS